MFRTENISAERFAFEKNGLQLNGSDGLRLLRLPSPQKDAQIPFPGVIINEIRCRPCAPSH